MEGKKRGGQKNPLYDGGKWEQRLLKIPDYEKFKSHAERHGLSVVEFSYVILKEFIEKLEQEDERAEKRSACINELSKRNSRNSN